MNPAPLDFNQRLDWLRLARTSGVGPVTFFPSLIDLEHPLAHLKNSLAYQSVAAAGNQRNRYHETMPPKNSTISISSVDVYYAQAKPAFLFNCVLLIRRRP